MSDKKDNFSYDEAVAEIEKILYDLQNNEALKFNDIIQKVDYAVDLLKQCKTKLSEVDKHLHDIFEEDATK